MRIRCTRTLVVVGVLAIAAMLLAPTAAAAMPTPEMLLSHAEQPGPGVSLTWVDRSNALGMVRIRRTEGCPFDACEPAAPSIEVTLPAGTTSYQDTAVTWRRSYVYVLTTESGGDVSDPVRTGISLAPPGDWVHRFFNKRTGTHLFTLDESERADVASRLGDLYVYEGAAFQSMYDDPHAIPVWRFFCPSTGVHFYTADPQERDRLVQELGYKWMLEGVAFNVLGYPDFPFLLSFNEHPFGPVYRCYDRTRDLHIFPVEYEIHALSWQVWPPDSLWAFFVPHSW